MPFYLGVEPSEREMQCLTFCKSHRERLRRALNKTYKDGTEVNKTDESQREPQRLMPAKLALSQLIRAIKKRNYMLLNSDAVPEINEIKPVVPDITQFAEDIRGLRALQSCFNPIQKRKNSEDAVST